MKFTGLFASALAATASAAGHGADTKLTLLHINDHHSHLTERSAGYVNIYGDDIPAEVAANNGGTTYIRAYYGGMPRLVTAFDALQADAEANGRDVLRLHAGDAITGTTYFTLFEGDADAKIMTHICFDAFVPGNHEFDKGDAGLAKFLLAMQSEAEASESCDSMPAVVGANIVPHAESPILAEGVPEIVNSKVFTLEDGHQVGVIGINIAGKTMNSSNPDEGTILLDEKETAQAEIDVLTAAGVNMIVLLTHIGYNNDQNWMAQLDGVDVVLGGDSHSLLGDESTAIFGSTRGPYATEITKDDGSVVCVVQAWDYAKIIGNLEVDFDADGKVVSCGGSPVFPLNPSKVTVRDAYPRYDMSEDDAAAVMASLAERSDGQAQPFEEDADAAADLEVYSAEVEVLSQTVVAQSSQFIGLEQGGFESGACDLVAQGFLLNPLSTADVAIQNRGGCRSDIQEGNFTVNDAYTLLPFSNTMVNIEMTGAQIKQVLEDAIDFYLNPSGSWGAYPRASGLRFDVNEAMEFGSRVSNLEVNAKVAGEWSAIDMESSYIVVTNNYIATPKDGYFEFGNIDDDKKVDSYVEYAQSFIEYAQSVGTLEPVPADRASTQNWTDKIPLDCSSIKDVQFGGSSSPVAGDAVLLCYSVVTSIVHNGFFVQDPDSFGPAFSSFSSGIFIYVGNADKSSISVGDPIIVEGTVSEYYGMTQISSVTSPIVPSNASKMFLEPSVIALPVDDMFEFEQHEGMLVNFVSKSGDALIISEYYNFDRFGEVRVCAAEAVNGRNYQFAETNHPDKDGYSSHVDLIERSCVTIDDNSGAQNPNPALFGGIYTVASHSAFRGGDEVTTLGLQGPLFYSFGRWRVQPTKTNDLKVEAMNPRSDPPVLPEAHLKLAFANLLNYWTTVGYDSSLRGADTEVEFERQTSKTIPALSSLEADIIAVCELENVQENVATHDLVDRLNEYENKVRGGHLAVFEAASVTAGYDLVGDDVIKVDVIYNKNKLELVGSAMLYDADVNPEILSMSTTGAIFDGYSRVPLAATFKTKDSGDFITVVSNHYKSKGSYGITPTGGDADEGVGAAAWNLLRTLTSKALLDWLKTYPTGVETDNIMIFGDLNAYAMEDSIIALMDGGYYSAVDFSSTPPPYTYLFDGQFGTLDYALVSKASSLTVTGADIWHINADEPDLIDYNMDYGRDPTIFDASIPNRYSDHDPVLVAVNFGNTKSFAISGKSGCITAFKDKERVQVKPCTGFKNQQWQISEDGQIKSSLHDSCLKRASRKKFLVVDSCDGDDDSLFGYNSFDGSLYLMKNPSKVVTENKNGNGLRFMHKKYSDENKWMIDYGKN